MSSLAKSTFQTPKKQKAETAFWDAYNRLAKIMAIEIPEDIKHAMNIEHISGNARIIEEAIDIWNMRRLQKEDSSSGNKFGPKKSERLRVALDLGSQALILVKVLLVDNLFVADILGLRSKPLHISYIRNTIPCGCMSLSTYDSKMMVRKRRMYLICVGWRILQTFSC